MKVLNVNSDRNGKIAAAIYTVVCLFFLFALKCESPKEDYSNEGVIVNLGFTDNGKSENTPEAIQEEIEVETKKILEKQYVQLSTILVRDITLPPTIKKAIEGKLKQEQESLEYEFKLQKAKKEIHVFLRRKNF